MLIQTLYIAVQVKPSLIEPIGDFNLMLWILMGGSLNSFNLRNLYCGASFICVAARCQDYSQVAGLRSRADLEARPNLPAPVELFNKFKSLFMLELIPKLIWPNRITAPADTVVVAQPPAIQRLLNFRSPGVCRQLLNQNLHVRRSHWYSTLQIAFNYDFSNSSIRQHGAYLEIAFIAAGGNFSILDTT